MKKPRSLRRDLALGLGAGLTALWILAMLGATLIVREELDEVYDSLMEQTADRLLPLAADRDLVDLPPQAEALLFWAVRDENGTILQQSTGASADIFAVPSPEGFSTRDDHRYFVRSTAGRTLDVASPLNERREAAWGVLSTLLFPALLLLPLCLFGVIAFTSYRLRPVRALSAEVAGRTPDDLRPLMTSGLQAELLPIRDEMNHLMANLSKALHAERAFSANAAHELRTPIAATLAHVQLLMSEVSSGPAADRARRIERELKRVTRLVEKLLQLARAEHLVPQDTVTDVSPILRLVADDFQVRPLVPAGAVDLRIDPDAFAILARNLIENAVCHGTDVQVCLSPDGTLRVSNGGAVVPAATLAQLTRRFERANSRAEGSGLGLAIVATIAQGANLKLELASPRHGYDDGFEAVISPDR
ncbi:histidine kinase dimerization/phospho-acceptor domain-containing protein [Falsirhodobacter sp. alg1]|uniref:histidine kinase dimerization/phospho-acceptor domain-containing protein n=1 Tax=Falsirhodobacter sp. alg1 TaxID=1472418 RepID=UPI000788FA9E|nr:histidine kinase dimerization/phospho-acceptor domain-containing protein [Falsirhodobacter sp. alg1]